MFLILEGEGELRFGDERYPLAQARRHRLPDRAGRRSRTRSSIPARETMRYLALSTVARSTSANIPIRASCWWSSAGRTSRGPARMFRAETGVDYYDREEP